jgi:hypothetical protein
MAALVRLFSVCTPFESLTPARQIAGFFRVFEFLARVLMLASGPPVVSTPRRLSTPSFVTRPRRAPHLCRRTRLFQRGPQLAPGEIFHHRIRVLLMNATERGQQVLAISRTKRCRKTARDDCPIGKPWRH